MLIARTLPDLRAALTGDIGFVPTMGALHEGHLALIAAAKRAGGKVAASIFVNPKQFGPNEDFSRYPRTEASDLEKLAAAGCHVVWLPDVATMYPDDAATMITLEGPALRWEGAVRPGHFAGVATVVAKLFGQVRPTRAYFGEKDFQQVQVIRRMVADLLLPVEVIAIPTVRETDGLALSSRNRFLSAEDRAKAPALFAALQAAATSIRGGADITETLAKACHYLMNSGLVPDYFSLVDAGSLEPLQAFTHPARILAAAKLGPVRLLDNIAV
ncbi:MAG: pantoate--beta-alanine ligase [Acidocella sp. 20-57-95]|nr:MAG: pantoate--beta-alanine ligase [Acidocella sp. 20-57-95]OYV61147.1 MAG: pantoate--beta-alanine ligase [Acidocella sp. 21-58-7]HQT64729.1 pantoate--beta-alanine ligase [Acidocella sp.]HQU04807.1 pantoate--beta-alanine ligase [Acidocella sp.]